jgi:hypothetical protein
MGHEMSLKKSKCVIMYGEKVVETLQTEQLGKWIWGDLLG